MTALTVRSFAISAMCIFQITCRLFTFVLVRCALPTVGFVCVSGIIKAGNPAVICPMVTGSSVVWREILELHSADQLLKCRSYVCRP